MQLSKQRRHSEIRKYDYPQNNSVISEEAEAVAPDILHQEFDGIHGDQKRNDHPQDQIDCLHDRKVETELNDL